MEIYLDNAATTRVYDEVIDTVAQAMRTDYGNPASLHQKGVTAENYIRHARQVLAGQLKVPEGELIFTSGGSESNNMALIGGAMANHRAGKHLISTQIEHASVYQTLHYLEQQGFEVTYLPTDQYGVVDLEALRDAVRPDTILVSVMCVNNEIGTVQPLEDVVKIVKEINPHTLVHTDAVQGFGKIRLYPGRAGLDMMSVSGHKFHGPKGTGFLWVRDRVKLKPLVYGGGQQKGMRSGTENVPGTAGMAAAAGIEFTDFDEKIARLYDLRSYFIEEIEKLEGTKVNGGRGPGGLTLAGREDPACCAAPHIVSVSFEDVRAEVLLHALEGEGIFVSSGSACSSAHPQVSRTLQSIGLEKRYLDATLRFSFSMDTSREELAACIAALEHILPMLRRFTPGGRKKGNRHV